MASFDDLNNALAGISERVGSVKDDTQELLTKITELQQNPPTGMTPDQQAALDSAVEAAQRINGSLGEIDDMVPEPAAPQPDQPQPEQPLGDQAVDNSGNQPLPTGSIDNPVTGDGDTDRFGIQEALNEGTVTGAPPTPTPAAPAPSAVPPGNKPG